MNFIKFYKTQNCKNEFYRDLSMRAGSLITEMF